MVQNIVFLVGIEGLADKTNTHAVTNARKRRKSHKLHGNRTADVVDTYIMDTLPT